MTEVIILMLLDSGMILLLGATIFFCLRLNTRIKVLQDSKAEFGELITRFDATTSRAQQSIEDLQNISKRVNEQLSARLDKANFLADDLAFMIEKGGKIADRMEGRSNNAASATSNNTTTQQRPSSALPGRNSDDRANRSAQPGPALRGEDKPAGNATDRKRAALESMLNKVGGGNGNNEEGGQPAPRRPLMGASARLRSKAEQELYDALKSGNNN